MRPMSLLSLASRKSSDSQRSRKRSSVLSTLSTSSTNSQAVSVLLPNFEPAADSRTLSEGGAEMMDDDNLAWGRPTSPKAARRRIRFW
ncbi:hypothetical protein PHLGIDRAFT_18889 [Phlebiopsis gigantea 11061_1 CR5-6]|uniref:Uncharacterized protein n=1 Tax=Phlebiopsis gigantea (strain 11061_1 CR5-6) TaxID=745531 RepID=A0A0C3S0P5_PHLG1|nr:hypothetical protein PHLGIDRAFT_18889 [Phlebiopsis gigantea 11061_1 CR5-6]